MTWGPAAGWVGAPSRGRPQPRPGASVALRSRQPPVPAKVRGAVVGVHSAGVGQEGAEERLVPRAARRWRPPPLPGSRPSWAGSGPLPAVGGRRDRGRGQRKPGPAGALRSRAAARLLPQGPGRPRAPARWQRIIRAQAQLAQLERGRREEGRA